MSSGDGVPIIRARGLGKRYKIGKQVQGYQTLRESLTEWMTLPFRRAAASRGRSESDHIWAMKDISFEINRGEVVGLIGKNGAGKSTLLKVLSRITEPTEGEAWIGGRVGSLLEVGTGFHPELTGRDNVYLNGAVLGMRRGEIKRKFDEIVAFSGVERFIDTPIKRYSTGMTVRLAFSVAAHLETEVLLVDEVLAVGDVDFQKKCLDKMKDVTTQGRTVLFVSHNMAAVRGLCQRGILLEDGKITMDSDVDTTIRSYLDREESHGAVVSGTMLLRLREGLFDRQDPLILPLEVSVQNAKGHPQSSFKSTDPVFVSTLFKVARWTNDVRVAVRLVDDLNQEMLLTQTVDEESEAVNPHKDPGTYRATVQLPANQFGTRRYYVSISLSSSKNEEVHLHRVLRFDVEFQTYNNIHYGAGTRSFFRPCLAWNVGRIDDVVALPPIPEC